MWLSRLHPLLRGLIFAAFVSFMVLIPHYGADAPLPPQTALQLAFLFAWAMVIEPASSGVEIALWRAPHSLVDQLMKAYVSGVMFAIGMQIVLFDPGKAGDPATRVLIWLCAGVLFGVVHTVIGPRKGTAELLTRFYDLDSDVTRTGSGRRLYYGMPVLTILGVAMIIALAGDIVATDPTRLWYFILFPLVSLPRYQIKGSYLLSPQLIGGFTLIGANYYY